jgi:urea-proton symporter
MLSSSSRRGSVYDVRRNQGHVPHGLCPYRHDLGHHRKQILVNSACCKTVANIQSIQFIFAFTAYATSNVLGSPGAVYDALVAAAERHPVSGNAQGSYLTMKSTQGGIFFVINLVGNFGTVFCDNGYYNKAIAASPIHALPGYIAGGLSWFAIPWLAATTMGLSALALENNPVFPTYPNRIPTADVTAGLVLPDAAVALLGKGGAAATLLLIFMAVTSAMSAELIAVSSIWTYGMPQLSP